MEKYNKLTRVKRSRLSLQKVDERTNEVIDLFTKFLFSVGIRTTKERAWVILKKAQRLPFEYLIALNEEEGIEYQGAGKHISAKHGNQLMTIRELGRYELKAVSSKKDDKKTATIRYVLPTDLQQEIMDKIKVKGEQDE